LKNRKETHNPNDHIILCSSNISLFEACRKLKEARNETILEATFDAIIKSHHEAVPNGYHQLPKTFEFWHQYVLDI
jgi:hypothetical protein